MLARWESVLTRLERDPMQCARELDWVAKLALLERYRDRDGLDWDDAKLHLIDLQYADVRPEKGLYHRLVRLGRIDRLLDDADIEAAMHDPPDDTRAYFRGRCLEKYAGSVAAASWDSVIFDLPGRESLQRVPRWTRCGGAGRTSASCIDRCDTAERCSQRSRGSRLVDRVGVHGTGAEATEEVLRDRGGSPRSRPTRAVAERKEQLDEDIDAILDEIDDVLETERRGLREVVHPEGRRVSR